MTRSRPQSEFASFVRGKEFSPKAFMKARSPERFSDSVAEDFSGLDRSILEYHLDTLTSRGQETEFERFARRLAAREICPNLLPQTGPTGGGDSKVDAETYPVADALSMAWYVGAGREAASERWAFAFSAKKQWRGKLRSDIAKIAGTKRDYRKAYFVTNQYVSDRTRADVEDELCQKHGLDVRILDRSWILDRVLGNGHEDLAIQELGLATEVRRQVRRGPLDTQRENDLDDIEERIEIASREASFGFQFVEDCIDAVLLSRSLERPRGEVDGRIARAKRAAANCGSPHQQLVAAYHEAWTAFWWYEEYESLARLYGDVEGRAVGSQNAYELELLTNLWLLLHSTVRQGCLDEHDARLAERTDTLIHELERLSDEDERPSAALQARTLRLHMELLLNLGGDVDPVLRDLQEVVTQCEGLLGYPLTPLVDMLSELGGILGDRAAYDDLFATVVSVADTREGEISAARLLLRRGALELDADRAYEAIGFLGRALGRLYRQESREELVTALYLCGSAYERVGLLWAARGATLTAASVAIGHFWTYGDVTPQQAGCCTRVKWLEAQLGRLPHAMPWHEVERTISGVLAGPECDSDREAERGIHFDAICGMLILKTEIWQLKHLSRLPDVLEGIGLPLSSVALRFALGHREDIPEELVAATATEDKVKEFFSLWRDQPAAAGLPSPPSLHEGRKTTLGSRVLGCRVSVEAENESPCVELAESMLAALESLLATGISGQLVGREPVITLSVRRSDFAEDPFGFQLQDTNGRPHWDVACRVFDPHSLPQEAQAQLRQKLLELLASVLARVFIVGDPSNAIAKLFGDELALERSVNFTSSFVTVGNVLGPAPKTSIAAWSDPDAREYPLRRWDDWDGPDRRAASGGDTVSDRVKPTLAAEEPPQGSLDLRSARQTEMETVSLIREVLWDKAEWWGTAFLWTVDQSAPPVLAPMFRGANAASEIFAHWREELGEVDAEERLRVAIIRGISRQNPYAYRVVLGTDPTAALSNTEVRFAVMTSRMNTMEPTSDRNLLGFLDSYETTGRYVLAHSVGSGEPSEISPVWDNCIAKRELHVRDAWQIARDDFDNVGIALDDDPIVPPDQEEAPVLELLSWLRAQKGN